MKSAPASTLALRYSSSPFASASLSGWPSGYATVEYCKYEQPLSIKEDVTCHADAELRGEFGRRPYIGD